MRKLFLFLFLMMIPVAFSQEKIEVFFDFAKEEPAQKYQDKLREWIKENPNAEILKIQGFCDTIDTRAFNVKLAEKRIQSVEKILKENNVLFSEDIEKTAFGEDFDYSLNQDENRKVVLYYKALSESGRIFKSELETARNGDKLKLQNLNFYGGQDVVLPHSEPVLADLFAIMKDNPSLVIEIQGHICCNTVEDDNLSTKRAKRVYDYLIGNGIVADRLSYRGFSSTQPIYPLPENTVEEQKANRRVEILIVSK